MVRASIELKLETVTNFAKTTQVDIGDRVLWQQIIQNSTRKNV